jgi:catalase
MDFDKKEGAMKKGQLTTSASLPVGDNQNALSTGPRGPLLVLDWLLSFR